MNSILLAGGQSTRFGSNKALANLGNQIIIKRIINTLDQVSDKVYVVVDRQSKYSFLRNIQVVEDIIINKGPLGGLYTGLYYSDSNYNFLMACDMPLITVEYLEFLKKFEKSYDILVPEHNNFIEPLAGIYSKNCHNLILKEIKNNNLKFKSFFKQANLSVINEEDIREINDPDRLFCNINYTEDLKKAEKMIRGK